MINFPKERVESTIQERFFEIVRHFPQRLAVSDVDRQLSYAELSRAAGGVADALRSRGVRAEAPVAVLADQGASAIVALLGINLAGAVFAPLDVLDPPPRSRTLLDLAGARLLVSTTRRRLLAEAIAQTPALGVEVLNLDETAPVFEPQPEPRTSPRGPASIFFTSGSTGTPKAVLDLQRNVLHNVYRYTTLLRISPDDRLSAIQRLSFSGIASSIFGALLNGATLCTFPLDAQNLTGLPSWVEREGVTIFHSVPAILRVLTASGRFFPSVRIVRLEGDRATWDDVARARRCFRPETLVANGLGTTETGLASQLRIDASIPLGSGILPVGRAAPEVDVIVVGEGLEPVPIGVVGEVAVRSAFLAQEYLSVPSLTRERFLADPDGGERRVYLTGDLGRFSADGELTVLGRRDGTAKIAGVRIEPAEVEAAILALPGIKEARVFVEYVREDTAALAAIVVPASGRTTLAEIRSALAASLPSHMIPPRIEVAQELPLDANWKARLSAAGNGNLLPRTPLEAAVKEIWEEILGTKVGIDDSFVELGGDSLAAAEIALAIAARLGRDVPQALLARTPTVATLAAALDGSYRRSIVELVVLADGGPHAPVVLIPDHRGDPLVFAELARRLGPSGPVWSVSIAPRDETDRSLDVVADEVVKALRPALLDGPYHLCGFCYGALLTLEVARRLRAGGADVRPVLLGVLPEDLESLVSTDARRRWDVAYGRRPFSLARLRYHVRRARRRSGRELVRYVRATGRRGSAHLAALVRKPSPSPLQVGAHRFKPTPLRGDVRMVLAQDTVIEYTEDPQQAWAGLADRVEVRLVAGPWTDRQLLESPASAALASTIREALRARGG